MKYIRLFALLCATLLFSSYDCGCSVDDGNGGNWTLWYNCDGSGNAIAEHFEDSYDQYASQTHIISNSDAAANC